MAYSSFTNVRQVMKKFDLTGKRVPLFQEVIPISPSSWLVETLDIALEMVITSEKERSERLVTPILMELSRRNNNLVTIYSGRELNVDAEAGLNGECDFLLSWGTLAEEVDFPLFSVVEAKRNDLDQGTAQCLAQMMGSKLFNEAAGVNMPWLYGASTIGTEWHFHKMTGNKIEFGIRHFSIYQLDELLGVLQFVLDDCRILTPQDELEIIS